MKMTMTDGTVFEGSLAEYTELLTLAKALDAKVEADVATIKGEQTAPVIPQVGDVVTFEGFDGEYRKVEREAQAGDVVVFTFSTSVRGSTVSGKPYVTADGTSYINDKGRSLLVSGWNSACPNPDVYEKVEAKYVPQEGDIVVVTAKAPPMHGFDIGDIVKITTTDSGGNCDIGITKMGEKTMKTGYTDVDKIRKATPAEVEAYEKAVHKASFSVGDYVKLVNSKRENNGAICVISDIDGLSLPVKLRHISGKFPETTSYATYDQIVKATEQEVADASKPKLKAGDTVIFTADKHEHKVGKIAVVRKIEGDGTEVVSVGLNDLNGESSGWADVSVLRKATEEEVAKHVDEAKWAQIGRKVGEVKVGDLVVITEYCCGAKVGEIIKVSKTREESYDNTRIYYDHHTTTHGFTAHHGAYELIAPVDAVFNA